MRYEMILFDLDDTLCDYRLAREEAKVKINKILVAHNIFPEDFWRLYHSHEPQFYRQFLENKLSLEVYRLRRFSYPLKALGFSSDLASEINQIYLNHANQEVQLFPDVPEVLNWLNGKIPFAILTNGPSDGQRMKLKSLGLEPICTHVFISEEIGYVKPASACFAAVEATCGVGKNILMVGDSLKDDYEGALNYGFDALFLNREQKPISEVKQIHTLTQLLTFLQ